MAVGWATSFQSPSIVRRVVCGASVEFFLAVAWKGVVGDKGETLLYVDDGCSRAAFTGKEIVTGCCSSSRKAAFQSTRWV